MLERENALKEWLKNTLKTSDFSLTPLTGDASFRRYFRLQYGTTSQIVMDAPPGKEDLTPFIKINRILEQAGLLTPQIYAQNLQEGFLLLSDLGDSLLLSQLNDQTVDTYYQSAIQMLFTMHSIDSNQVQLPHFDYDFMRKEMQVCVDWFLKAYLALNLQEHEYQLLETSFDKLATEIASQPQVFIHRDYHSRNLMCGPNHNLAVIDFQDAMSGPLTYDLVSLLKDCYISWPRAKILELLRYFFDNSAHCSQYSFAGFVRAFDLCGLQRHIKVLGVFSRLALRDSKPGYLKDLPLTLNYVLEATEIYPEFHPLFDFLQQRVHLP